MTLTQWKNSFIRFITWDYIAREISLFAPEGERFYTNQLHRCRSGKRKPREWELKALLELTNNEVDCFYDPVEQEA